MKATTVLCLTLSFALAACHSSESTRVQAGKAAAASNGPCDISPLPKITPSIYIANKKTVKYLGDVDTGSVVFRIYYYDFSGPPDTGHGNYRLIVFSSDCKYLGLYVTDDNPVRIEGNRVIYHTQDPGSVVTFTGDKPPDHIWLDGDLPEFWTPEREQKLYESVGQSQH